MARRTTAEHAHLADAVTELLHLWPAFTDALERDQAGGDGRGTSTPFRLPMNDDVIDAIRELEREVPLANSRARSILKHPPRWPVVVVDEIAAAGSLHLELEAHDVKLARRYADAVYSWQRTARRAIGLSRAGTGIGIDCPLHPDRPVELKLRGSEGELLAPYIKPGKDEAVRWKRRDTIYCPDTECEGSWPEHLWLTVLRRLIKQVEADRALAEWLWSRR